MGPRAHITIVQSSKSRNGTEHSARIMVRNIIAHYCIVWFICVSSTKAKPRCGIHNPHRLRFFILLLRVRNLLFNIFPSCTPHSHKKGVKLELAAFLSPSDAAVLILPISQNSSEIIYKNSSGTRVFLALRSRMAGSPQ